MPTLQQVKEGNSRMLRDVSCSGCIHAPHLPARRRPALQRGVARARVLTDHVLGPVERWLEARAHEVS